MSSSVVLEREAPSVRGDLDRPLYQSKRDLTAHTGKISSPGLSRVQGPGETHLTEGRAV
jgi:hypothetical protein